jgi:1-acyl-sn-glycerol-3-phosphate acyltransferase
VEQVVDKFNSNSNFLLALSPEGTRKKVEALKTGFYFIAKQANVPIVMTGFDFKNKTLKVSSPFFTTNNMEEDLEKVLIFFRSLEGKDKSKDLRHL